jgi:hypothetical protein
VIRTKIISIKFQKIKILDKISLKGRVADKVFHATFSILSYKHSTNTMKLFLVILSVSLLTWSCVKNETLTPVTQTLPTAVQMGIQESIGIFSSGVHPTSGTVRVVADKTDAKKKYLSFENFKSDEGPDLYIYLAEDKTAKGFTSVVKLNKSGTFVVDIPEGTDLTKQKYVLIWCKQFSVLFGSAKLE